jgi:hypothetical protein
MFKPVLFIISILAGVNAAAAETTERPTRIEIETQIDLPHPAERVWQVLADLAAYPEWNPYHARVEGAAERGARLEVEVHKPNGHRLVIHPRVIVAEPDRSLVWGGGVPGTFRGVHRFDLEPLSEDCTRLNHTEVFAGLFVGYAELGSIEAGYAAVNAALADRLASVSRALDEAC